MCELDVTGKLAIPNFCLCFGSGEKSFVLKSYRCKNPSVCTCFEVALSLVFLCSFLEFGCLRPLKIRLFARAFQRYKNHISSKLFDQDLIEVNSRRNFSIFS